MQTKSPNTITTYHKLAYMPLIGYWAAVTPFVFMRMWNWFIAGYYNAYEVGYSEAVSVVIFIGFVKALMFPSKSKSEDTIEEYKDLVWKSITHPWIVLLFAYIFKSIISLL